MRVGKRGGDLKDPLRYQGWNHIRLNWAKEHLLLGTFEREQILIDQRIAIFLRSSQENASHLDKS